MEGLTDPDPAGDSRLGQLTWELTLIFWGEKMLNNVANSMITAFGQNVCKTI